MTTLKITKIGNSLGVILPASLLTQLDLAQGDRLFITKATTSEIRITAYDPDFEEQMEAARQGMKQYKNTLRKLAK